MEDGEANIVGDEKFSFSKYLHLEAAEKAANFAQKLANVGCTMDTSFCYINVMSFFLYDNRPYL